MGEGPPARQEAGGSGQAVPMSWAFGRGRHPFTGRARDIGYGVAAFCDEPRCWNEIDRGKAFYCGGPYSDDVDGGEWGCGGYFCGEHLGMEVCEGRDEDDGNPRIPRGEFCRRCAVKIRRVHNRECSECREAFAA